MPAVTTAFLDEIFKASSSILNALLTILNERIYHNGAQRQAVPLRALIAASNELPTDQEELSALYDRFLVRIFVDNVSLNGLSQLLNIQPADDKAALAHVVTREDIDSLQQATKIITLPSVVQQALQQIWFAHRETFKDDRRERLSDRRLMKCLNLLRVSAATNGRTEVDLSDVFLLKDCLWNHPDNLLKVRELLIGVLSTYSHISPASLSLTDTSHGIAERTYEVDETGTTLVPVSLPLARSSAIRGLQVPVFPMNDDAGQMNAAVKGFRGKGTNEDPLLVETLEDLMDLSREEVGKKGYFFRQIKSIDLSPLSSWAKFDFFGHYNGCGYKLKNRKRNGDQYNTEYLFSKIIENSSIKNIIFENLGLAEMIINSKIESCTSNINFCDKMECGSIEFCNANESLIASSAYKVKINSCYSNYSIFGISADNCEIINCCINFKEEYGKNQYLIGGEPSFCHVDSCYFSGKAPGRVFYGLAHYYSNGDIKNCFIGPIDADIYSRIIYLSPYNSAQLANNYSVDSNKVASESYDIAKDEKHGESIAKILMTQRFFENVLGWDFENVWYWNEEDKCPALRHLGVNSNPADKEEGAQFISGNTDKSENYLEQQFLRNIWL